MLIRTLLGAVLATAACNTTDTAVEGGEFADDDGDVDQSDKPVFDVLLTDAPGDYEEVWVDIDAVEIHSETGWLTITDTPQSFDLLTLQNDVTAALGGTDLAPGHYSQLRLLVSNTFVVVDGASEDMTVASGAQTGIKINLDADIEPGMTYTAVIDFDAAKSVKRTGQGYLMTPVIHVKDLVGTPVGDSDEDLEDETDGEGDDAADSEGSDEPGGEDTSEE